MLNYIKADNYCSLVNFQIDFSSINLLLGNNGTGKSTVFSLIDVLRFFILQVNFRFGIYLAHQIFSL